MTSTPAPFTLSGADSKATRSSANARTRPSSRRPYCGANLARLFLPAHHHRPRRRHVRPRNRQRRQPLGHLPARSHPLHNLLPQIAALAEVQRLVAPRLLHQVGLQHVLAIARHAVFDPYHPRLFRRARHRVPHHALPPPHNHAIPRPARQSALDHQPRRPHRRRTLNRILRRRFRDVLRSDIVGNDVAVQMLENLLPHLRLHVQYQRVVRAQDRHVRQ